MMIFFFSDFSRRYIDEVVMQDFFQLFMQTLTSPTPILLRAAAAKWGIPCVAEKPAVLEGSLMPMKKWVSALQRAYGFNPL